MKQCNYASGFLVALLLVCAATASATEPLPKWLTLQEKLGHKGPADTYRRNNIEKYRITTPPPFTPIPVGEYEESQALLLGWLPGVFDELLAEIVTAVYTDVKVIIVTNWAPDYIKEVLVGWGVPADVLSDPARFQFITTELESAWMRDYGPIFVRDPSSNVVMIDHRYASERYFDDKVPTEINAALGLGLYRPSLNLEGGNFVSTTEGLCLTTYASFWGNVPNDESYVEQVLRDYYGCLQVVFLWPLSGEGTGHIDMFLKFLDDVTVILAQDDPAADCLNAEILDLNAEILADVVTPSGRPLVVHRIPMPRYSDGIWRTYTNSTIVGGKVLVPVYSDDRHHEAVALGIYSSLMPGYEIVPIDSTAVIPFGGAVHCVTMTMPAGTLSHPYPDPAPLCGDTWICDPVSGCGDYTYEGICHGNTTIWCDPTLGVALWYPCDMSCTYVEPGYPCEESCGYVSGWGYYCTGESRCNSCYDHCDVGMGGCTAAGGRAWQCGEAADGDDCLERLYEDCAVTEFCSGGRCICRPQCEGRECGADGCGGSCGTCPPGYECVDGRCIYVPSPEPELEPEPGTDEAMLEPPPWEPADDTAVEPDAEVEVGEEWALADRGCSCTMVGMVKQSYLLGSGR